MNSPKKIKSVHPAAVAPEVSDEADVVAHPPRAIEPPARQGGQQEAVHGQQHMPHIPAGARVTVRVEADTDPPVAQKSAPREAP